MKNFKINLFFGFFLVASASFSQAVKKDTVKSNQLDEVVVRGSIIDVAKERKTPVAVSTISAAEIQAKIGNQEFPDLLKNMPSVYASKSGGGYGDSRVNIRGFAQENIAVMINGMPVNDMENGAVYWSNWTGLTDVASSVQVQRGLGASKLAIASVGGTINVVTRSSDMKEGGSVSSSIGNDNFLKSSFSYSTGMMKNGLSASFLLSKTRGDGYINGTNFEGTNYFLGLGYKLSDKHQFEFTFTGAAQWHHQRSTAITLAQYLTVGGGNPATKYNRDWGYLQGSQYNMNQNFYNKPIASINWDYKINETTKLSSIVYGSWGRGGGAGAWGRANGLNFNDDRWRTGANGVGTVDFDKLYAYNSGQTVQVPTTAAFTAFAPATRALVGGQYVNTAGTEATNGVSKIAGINSHDWYGGIINLDKKINNLSLDFGLDLRTYKGIHVRYLNDLLGGSTFKDVADVNNPTVFTSETSSPTPSLNPFDQAIQGTPILRNWIGNVNWLGAFGQAEYVKDNLTAFVQTAVSQQSFQRQDYFVYANTNPLQNSVKKSLMGGNFKAGANYNFNDNHNAFVNAGYYSKQPFLTAVFPNNRNVVNTNLTNEKILGFEAGYGFRNAKLNVNVNVYNTEWKDRYQRTFDASTTNLGGYYDFQGITEVHQGLELEMKYKLFSHFKLNGMVSYGNWFYKGNSISNRFDQNGDPFAGGTVTTLYLDNVKVGNTAQVTAALGGVIDVSKNMSFDANYNFNDKLYAAISPNSLSSSTNKGTLQLPSFDLIDAGVSYKWDLANTSESVRFRLNVNNLLDTKYIAESNTNIFADDAVAGVTPAVTYAASGRMYNGVATGNQVFFGFGRTWNFSLSYNF
ncbi:MAG: TonB-dependent receptor [Flavobacteriaceae bacterium]|nr:TonB-dependent receptor [Flavobacteriaceae bacterium]